MKNNFTNQKPFIVEEKHLTLPWNGGKNGKYFRCGLCGDKFITGDIIRWVYTNDVQGAGGNPFVCERCDGTREEILKKLLELKKEYNDPKFWRFKINT